MKYPCENCKLRAQYDKNPKSLIGRFWRWQINFCPSWRGYFKTMPPAVGEAISSRCHPRSRKNCVRNTTSGSINVWYNYL